jgi:fucose 4-O-acetylase-like acetyltransferase
MQSMDALKLFAIYLVLWGHIIQFLLSSKFTDEPMYRIIYSFHMPLFMMISGFFSENSMKREFKDLIISKFYHLILPIISWAVLPWILKWIVFKLTDNGTMADFFSHVILYCLYSLWFLKSLFVCYILAYLCWKCGRYKIQAFLFMGLVTIISQFLPEYSMCPVLTESFRMLGLDIMFPAFSIGLSLNLYMPLLMKNAKYIFVITGCTFIGMLLFWNADYFCSIPKIKTMFISDDFTELSIYIYRRVYRIIIGIFGSITFITLSWTAFHKRHFGKVVNTICDWGKYTLAVYILQSFILERYMAQYLNFDNISFELFNFVVSPTISLAVLLVCVLIAKLLMANRTLAFVLFGKR